MTLTLDTASVSDQPWESSPDTTSIRMPSPTTPSQRHFSPFPQHDNILLQDLPASRPQHAGVCRSLSGATISEAPEGTLARPRPIQGEGTRRVRQQNAPSGVSEDTPIGNEARLPLHIITQRGEIGRVGQPGAPSGISEGTLISPQPTPGDSRLLLLFALAIAGALSFTCLTAAIVACTQRDYPEALAASLGCNASLLTVIGLLPQYWQHSGFLPA